MYDKGKSKIPASTGTPNNHQIFSASKFATISVITKLADAMISHLILFSDKFITSFLNNSEFLCLRAPYPSIIAYLSQKINRTVDFWHYRLDFAKN